MSVVDLLWLLLPVAAAAGWFAAKRSDSRSSQAFWDYTSHFHQDLNVLLSDQNVKSSDLFDHLSDASRDTADTHIALGNHYRRKGEMDRAIRLHQSVIDKPELDDDVKATARFELARDYDSAGLLDRSESVFNELVDSGHRTTDAYQSLMQLHERERDWQQAIKVALNCVMDTGENCSSRIAHYYCEMAEIAIKEARLEDANALLTEAMSHWPQSARANILVAEQALSSADYVRAAELYDYVESIRPELMPEIIDNRFEVFRRAGDAGQLKEFVARIHGQRNAYSVIRSTRAIIAEQHSDKLADRFFKDQILQRPSLKGLRDWAHDQLVLSKPGEKEKVQVICNLLDQVMEDKPAYRCSSCGFQGNVMHWRCPGCGTWDSVSTIIGVEGE